MKPENWNSMTPAERTQEAKALMSWERGPYLIRQAADIAGVELDPPVGIPDAVAVLSSAIPEMKTQTHPELSNIEDMEIILEWLMSVEPSSSAQSA